jgi:Ser/Thr protein kinase RdoA (MazF antagonist)
MSDLPEGTRPSSLPDKPSRAGSEGNTQLERHLSIDDDDEAGDPERTPEDDRTPFAGLTPQAVLDALESVGFLGDGRLIALNSYENRVYLVHLETGNPVVVKFYRPGRWTDEQIAEEHALLAELVEDEVPAVPPLPLAPAIDRLGSEQSAQATILAGGCLARWRQFRFAVFERRGGRAPEPDQPEVLEWIGRFIARIHRVGARHRFAHRPTISPEALGDAAREAVIASGLLPLECERAWLAAVDEVLDRVRAGFAAIPGLNVIRLHGDCHPGNVLWTPTGPHFVDFDDARNGPAMQDLWMLISGSGAEAHRSLERLLEGYETVRPFDRRELALLEPLRGLRLIHYAGWIASRWDDPAFPAAFPGFGTSRYWNERTGELREQLSRLE